MQCITRTVAKTKTLETRKISDLQPDTIYDICIHYQKTVKR